MLKQRNAKTQAWFLIFLSWLVYSTSYLGKLNYSANITQIIDYYGITKAQAGTVPTFFFFAYGIGQVFNGIFSKKYNIKWMIFISLIVSAAINLTIAITTDFAIVKWLWMVNGFVLSILWPTLIRMLSENIPQKDLGKSSITMGTTVATGTLVIYGLSSVYAVFNMFKLAFYTAAFAVIAVAVVWLLFYNKAIKKAKAEKAVDNEYVKEERDKKAEETTNKFKSNGERKVFYATIGVLCFCAVGINLVKDGLTTWVPSILKEEFSMSDALSILLTLLLPVLAIFGNAVALSIHKKIPGYIDHNAAVFAVMAVLIGGIIGCLKLKSVVLVLLGMIAVNFLASSLNSLVTSIFPLFMRSKVNSGMIAGVINGFCYVGSTISAYGLGVIADGFGWTAVFLTLIGFSLLVCVVWAFFRYYKYKVG